MKSVKIVTVGDGSVGKTCLLISYTTNAFPGDYVPTVFDDYSANILVDDSPINVGLWDTAGQSDYDRLRPLSYPETDCFIICYAPDNRTSFKNVTKKWVPELTEHAPGVPFVLCCTKIDLRDDKDTISRVVDAGETMVTTKEGEELATQVGASKFVECSALTQTQLKDVFEETIHVILSPSSSSKRVSSKKCGLI